MKKNKTMAVHFLCLVFHFHYFFIIITILTLVNRSVITTGQFNIGADDNLLNCKYMKSLQSVQIALFSVVMLLCIIFVFEREKSIAFASNLFIYFVFSLRNNLKNRTVYIYLLSAVKNSLNTIMKINTVYF